MARRKKYKIDTDYFHTPLRTILLEQGRRQNWLAAKLGVSPALVSQWCCQGRGIAPEYAREIARILDVPIEDAS